MKKYTVAKYNIFKGLSTICTIGSPIITLLSCSNMIIHRPDTAISAAGIYTILICILLLKDKIAEKFKVPSAFVLSAVVFVFILLVEKILLPMKIVALVTMITSGIDEVTFKRTYKIIEKYLPEAAQDRKIVGFIFTTTKKLNEETSSEGEVNVENN